MASNPDSQKTQIPIPYTPFALLTRNLILLPTPTAIYLHSYLTLYASLHANPSFCTMAFGHHFPAVSWDEAQTRETIQTRDIERCWQKRGMGDFAVGYRVRKEGEGKGEWGGEVQIVNLDELKSKFGVDIAKVEWLAYAGIRDATTTSLPPSASSDPPLPHYLEMIELRYGVAEPYWGKDIAREAAEAVMQWGAEEKGVRRYIAETERENARSGRVLQKMGFRESGTGYWQEEGEVEWERWVVGGA